MNIKINCTRPYDIKISEGIRFEVKNFVEENYKNARVFVITDDVVDSLYDFKDILKYDDKYILKSGEVSKNTKNLIDILEYLADLGYSRNDLIIAFGGGVIGDISGFVAATYLRGIDYISVPTTFLSAIDSSVGGKTAVNLKSGKNLMGAFYQPKRVFIDRFFFNTLSDEIFLDGVGEAIKYSMIASEKLYKIFKENKITKNSNLLDEIIKICLEIKRDFVNEDELDLGNRQILNYGHTFGHAIEKVTNLKITHGHAVALGMIIMNRYFNGDFSEEFEEFLKTYNLYRKIDFDTEDIIKSTLKDKKSRGEYINIVVVKNIGNGELLKVDYSKLREIYEKAKY